MKVQKPMKMGASREVQFTEMNIKNIFAVFFLFSTSAASYAQDGTSKDPIKILTSIAKDHYSKVTQLTAAEYGQATGEDLASLWEYRLGTTVTRYVGMAQLGVVKIGNKEQPFLAAMNLYECTERLVAENSLLPVLYATKLKEQADIAIQEGNGKVPLWKLYGPILDAECSSVVGPFNPK